MSPDRLHRLDGRVAMVTGAARGIGEAIAAHLGALGALVVLSDMSQAVEETAHRLSLQGIRTDAIVADVTDPSAMVDAAATIAGRHGIATLLVANAGLSYEADPLDHGLEDWRRAISVNLDGTFHAVRAFAPSMVEQGGGSIVVMSSIAGVKAVRPEKHVGYDVAKAGVAHMARVLGVEWARRGVRVNAVGPGYTDTEMLAAVGSAQPDVLRQWIEDMPIGRLLRRDEIAAAVAFLPVRRRVRHHRPSADGRRRLFRELTTSGHPSMHFVIHCLDYPDAVGKRLAHYDQHKAYLAAASVRTLVSGPLVASDNETMIGSFFLLEAEDIADVRRFHENDPFKAAGIWQHVSINPFLKRVDDRNG